LKVPKRWPVSWVNLTTRTSSETLDSPVNLALMVPKCWERRHASSARTAGLLRRLGTGRLLEREVTCSYLSKTFVHRHRSQLEGFRARALRGGLGRREVASGAARRSIYCPHCHGPSQSSAAAQIHCARGCSLATRAAAIHVRHSRCCTTSACRGAAFEAAGQSATAHSRATPRKDGCEYNIVHLSATMLLRLLSEIRT
jgi:hypothetical protein